MKTANVYRGQRRKCIGSIKRVAVLIAVIIVALIADTVSGRGGIQAKAATIASGEQGDTTWVADIEKGTLTITPKPGTTGDLKLDFDINSQSHTIPFWCGEWLYIDDKIKAADHISTINITGKIHSKSMYELFAGYKNVTKINGIKNIDTSETIVMSDMFKGCSSLTSLDINNFNTSNVIYMDGMFGGCSSLTQMDLNNFDTSKVRNMHDMFTACTSLKSLDLSNFNTAEVNKMDGMFDYCTSLVSLNIDNFNTRNVTSMRSMFFDCSSLASLNVSNFDTSNVTDMSDMFGCMNTIEGMPITTLDVSNFDTSKVTNMSEMFNRCTLLKSLDVSNFNTSKVTNMSRMFDDCKSLSALDVSNFDTSKVTNMSDMFSCCSSSLSVLDVSNFDTSNVTDMSGMFSGCYSLNALDVSNFDTSNVTDISHMFSGCNSLSVLDVSNFDTSNVTDMSGMFSGCYLLSTLDVSNFDTSNVTNMSGMFRNCRSLKRLDLSNFNTSNVTHMEYMFYMYEDVKLEYVNLSSFDTSAIINEIKKDINNNKYVKYDGGRTLGNFEQMFGWTLYNKHAIFTVTLGPKCYTCSMIKDGIVYKYGIQYSLPHLIGNGHQNYIIKNTTSNKEFKYQPDLRDKNKKYGYLSYDNPFADVWTSGMAGTWTMMPVETESTQYTITFKDGLTSATISSSSVEKGGSVSVPAAPSHDGYKFVEWNNKDKLTNIQSDVIVTAIYKKIEKPITNYTVTFKDGLTNSIISLSTVETGASASAPAAPFHDGYKFVGWDNKDKLSNIQSDVTVIAQYEKIDTPKKQYTIVFKDSVTGKVISSIRAEEGTSVTVPAIPKHDGYEFMSWDNKDKLTNIQSDVIVTAIYKKIEKPATKYTVIFKDGLANTVISSSVVEEGANVSVPTAPEHDGYEFVSWDNEDKLTNIQSDVTIIATYKKTEKPDNQSKQTVLPVKSDDNNQTISNQPNELEQTGINPPSLLVPLSAILSVALIAYYRRRSK